MTDVGVAIIVGTVFGFILGTVSVFLVLACYMIRAEERKK